MNKNQIENKNKCNYNNCQGFKYKDHDYCILHLKEFKKDEFEFNKVLKLYIKEYGWIFSGIFFPDNLFINNLPTEEIRFSGCHFSSAFELPEGTVIKENFIFDSCTFHNSVSISKCKFMKDVYILSSKFYGLFSLENTEFCWQTIFYYNKFKFGIYLYNLIFNRVMGLVFRNCDFRISFFYNSDIQNIEFILCNWNKKYIIAEEQCDLRIYTKFGIMGLPNTYFNKLVEVISNKHKKIASFIIKLFYRKEYDIFEEMEHKNLPFYIIHSGWNDSQMAEDTYRKLRLRYSQQGEPEIAGRFFYREKVNQRRQFKNFRRLKDYFLNELLIGYGEKPYRVFFSSSLIIILFSYIYKCSNLLENSNGCKINDIWSSIYFSIVTFTTLGYGDYHPTKWIRYFSSFEALLGAILMALFVVTLTRKSTR